MMVRREIVESRSATCARSREAPRCTRVVGGGPRGEPAARRRAQLHFGQAPSYPPHVWTYPSFPKINSKNFSVELWTIGCGNYSAIQSSGSSSAMGYAFA